MLTQGTTVVNIKRGDRYDVYCGRPSIWGNPFVLGRDGNRVAVIAKHARWIQTQPQLLARLSELKGKRLGCYCAPAPCHCDTLAGLADALPDPATPTAEVCPFGPGRARQAVRGRQPPTR